MCSFTFQFLLVSLDFHNGVIWSVKAGCSLNKQNNCQLLKANPISWINHPNPNKVDPGHITSVRNNFLSVFQKLMSIAAYSFNLKLCIVVVVVQDAFLTLVCMTLTPSWWMQRGPSSDSSLSSTERKAVPIFLKGLNYICDKVPGSTGKHCYHVTSKQLNICGYTTVVS
jgi:hypothetical protein